ncbi:MAG: hypothetical protein WC718_19370 [Phycisphaerales bacterium]|jgi:hypothetical protein
MSGKNGGKRLGAGRKPGAVSKVKRELAELAKGYTDLALKTLARVAESSESDSAAVSASVALLDRGYGKPPQAMTLSGDPDNPLKTEDVTDQKRLAAVALMAARAARKDNGEK